MTAAATELEATDAGSVSAPKALALGAGLGGLALAALYMVLGPFVSPSMADLVPIALVAGVLPPLAALAVVWRHAPSTMETVAAPAALAVYGAGFLELPLLGGFASMRLGDVNLGLMTGWGCLALTAVVGFAWAIGYAAVKPAGDGSRRPSRSNWQGLWKAPPFAGAILLVAFLVLVVSRGEAYSPSRGSIILLFPVIFLLLSMATAELQRAAGIRAPTGRRQSALTASIWMGVSVVVAWVMLTSGDGSMPGPSL